MKRRLIDLFGVCICLAAVSVVLLYPDLVRGSKAIALTAGILACVFLVLSVRDRKEGGEAVNRPKTGLPTETEAVTEAVLLSEEDTVLMVWDMYGKTSMVIGRDVKENQVDINLGQSPYASMVEIEHAVLNYSAGSWYVEDLGSANGLSVKKAGDGRVYKLSSDTPCRLERGDCLYIGLNRLLLR